MSDEQPTGGLKSLDDPVVKARVVRALFVLAPFMFVGCYLLAAMQGAEPYYALVIAAAGLAMDLGAALSIWFLGANAKYVAMGILALGWLFGHR